MLRMPFLAGTYTAYTSRQRTGMASATKRLKARDLGYTHSFIPPLGWHWENDAIKLNGNKDWELLSLQNVTFCSHVRTWSLKHDRTVSVALCLITGQLLYRGAGGQWESHLAWFSGLQWGEVKTHNVECQLWGSKIIIILKTRNDSLRTLYRVTIKWE